MERRENKRPNYQLPTPQTETTEKSTHKKFKKHFRQINTFYINLYRIYKFFGTQTVWKSTVISQFILKTASFLMLNLNTFDKDNIWSFLTLSLICNLNDLKFFLQSSKCDPIQAKCSNASLKYFSQIICNFYTIKFITIKKIPQAKHF